MIKKKAYNSTKNGFSCYEWKHSSNFKLENIIIIGAGLSGLHLAYLLKKKGIEAKIIEARPRLGGRIYSKSENGNTPIELGATWVWRHHQNLVQLIQELDLKTFQQKMDDYAIYQGAGNMPPQLFKIPQQEPNYRIVGGTGQIIQTLADKLETNQIHLSETVETIIEHEDHLQIKTNITEYTSQFVVSTLPPNLLVNQIQIQPPLPPSFVDTAHNTHTWMGDSIKVGLRYAKPFWREKDKSGTIFSQVGPVIEMYDHSNFEENQFALKGFLNPAFARLEKEERKQLIIQQLASFFGEEATQPESYEETIWEKEAFTFVEYEQHVLPHQNNGHQVFQKSYLANRFFLAGAETDADYPGYMNAAVRSAAFVFKNLIKIINNNE